MEASICLSCLVADVRPIDEVKDTECLICGDTNWEVTQAFLTPDMRNVMALIAKHKYNQYNGDVEVIENF